MRKSIFEAVAAMSLLFSAGLFAEEISEPDELKIFRQAYPGITFECEYDKTAGDYLIKVGRDENITYLYWQDGKFLPESEISDAASYFPILYRYADEIPDPADFDAGQVERIKDFSSTERRRNSSGTPPFLYDAIYDCGSRKALETHIVRTTFLGKKTTIHERMLDPLKRVEKRINRLTLKNAEVKNFVDNLASADSYNWREIADSKKRSFHSLGIAIDVLPYGWSQKNIYWAWRRDIDKNWMLLPLEKRWFPPDEVIRIFEEEGFIYGGKWIIWDNMHFEYHPELIIYNGINPGLNLQKNAD